MLKIEHYTLGEELGSGVNGTTYLGVDEEKGENVAVKVMIIWPDNSPTADEEVESLKALSEEKNSKYIAQYYDSFDGYYERDYCKFIVMEYIKGKNLLEFIKAGKDNIPSILYPIMLQLMLRLKFIHNTGYAHRDIKPNNIMLSNDYNIKYIDFGLTCLKTCIKPNCRNECTNNKRGAFDYASPYPITSLESEQANDIWGFGLTLIQLWHGLSSIPTIEFTTNENGSLNKRLVREEGRTYTNDKVTEEFLLFILEPRLEDCPTIDLVLNKFVADVLTRPWR
jgi:serine/threonine protein kinase